MSFKMLKVDKKELTVRKNTSRIIFLLFSCLFLCVSISVDAQGVTTGGLQGYSNSIGGGAAQQSYYDIYQSFGGVESSSVFQGWSGGEAGDGMMTQEQWEAAMEAFIESDETGMWTDAPDEAVIAAFYASAGITGAPIDASSPEYAALADALRGNDNAAINNIATSLAANNEAPDAEAGDEANPEENILVAPDVVVPVENPELAADALDIGVVDGDVTNPEVVLLDEVLPEEQVVPAGNQTQPEAVDLADQSQPENDVVAQSELIDPEPVVESEEVSLGNQTVPEQIVPDNIVEPNIVYLENQTNVEAFDLGNQTQPEIAALGDQDDPETIALGNQTKPETVALGNQTQPEIAALGDQDDPETIALGNQTKPDTIVLGNTTQPDMIYLGNQTKPETAALGNQTKPETLVLGDQTQPDVVVLGNQTQPEPVCVGSGCNGNTADTSSNANADNDTGANNTADTANADNDTGANNATDVTNTADTGTNNTGNNTGNNRNVVTNYNTAASGSSAGAVVDNPYSLQSAALAVKVADAGSDLESLPNTENDDSAPQIVILPASQAELAASMGNMAIDLQLKTASAKSVAFYIRKGVAAAPLYLGGAASKSNGIWEYKVDLNASPLPNGNYYIFAQIDRGDGTVYRSTDVYVAVSIAPPDNQEQKAIAEEVVAQNTASIEQSEKAIQATVEQVSAGRIFGNYDLESKMDQLAQLIRVFQRLENLFEEKNVQRKAIMAQIDRLNLEIENLPDNAIELIRGDKIRLRQYFANKKGVIEQEIAAISAGMKKTTKEKNSIVDEVLNSSANESEKGVMREQILQMERDVAAREKEIIESRKILLRDTDGDGLLDGQEIEMGTDMLNPDTDGDGLLDGDEVSSGRDPLKPDESVIDQSIDPASSAPVGSDVYAVEKVRLVQSSENGDKGIYFSGRGLPLSYVTLFIYSAPVVVAVKTDEYGRWTYTLDKPLEEGTHTVYAALVNGQGRVASRSEVYVFDKKGDQIERIIAGQEASISSSVGEMMDNFKFMLIFAIVAAIVAAILIIGYLANRRAKQT